MVDALHHEPSQPWEDAVSSARRSVEALIARLPENLRREASAVECEFRERSDDPDGQDTLGGYTRSARLIRLYLHTIDRYCREEDLDYTHELEATFLHELGHHLGLAEGDLEAREL